MTKSLDDPWLSSSLLRPIGYCLLVLTLFDLISILVPLRLMNPTWEFQTIGAIVERVPVPLLEMGLVFYGENDYRATWEGLPLKFLSWVSLIAGVLLVLLAPLLLVDNLRINDQINYQMNAQISQQMSQIGELEQQIAQATTTEDINSVVARLNIQGVPADIKNSQQLKSRLVAEITQAKETVRPKAEAAWADRRFALVKNFVKWFLGALVSGALFGYIWRYTRWARRGSRFSK